jgi:RNA polymerase sigma factor (sigma-70 family)
MIASDGFFAMAMPDTVSRPERASLLADPALRSALVHFVRARVPPVDAEDLVQTTLTEALAAARAPDEPEELRRWLHGIAKNKVADFHRKAGREVPREPTAGEELVADSAPHSARELLRWAQRELPAGTEAQSTLEWMLREGEGEKLEQIAEEANVPAPRVRQRVSRLRRHLRARWAAAIAAVTALALFTYAQWRTAEPGPDEIAREQLPPVAPDQRAIELRKRAFELCDAGEWQRCLESLDRAKAIDPSGDGEERVEQARSAAGRALAPGPAPTPAPMPVEPKPPLPEKPRNNAVPLSTESAPPPPTPKRQQDSQAAPRQKGMKSDPASESRE